MEQSQVVKNHVLVKTTFTPTGIYALLFFFFLWNVILKIYLKIQN